MVNSTSNFQFPLPTAQTPLSASILAVIERLDRVLVDMNFSDDVRRVYNPTKSRLETWVRCATGAQEWILVDAIPSRTWEEHFMSEAVLAITLLGINMGHAWSFNGRRNGANDPANNSFLPANEVGGGLSLNVIAGGLDNDYTALHWGGNYPVMCSESPHLQTVGSLRQITTMGHVRGLVDNTRPAANAAFAYPDNGIYLRFDTDLDANLHFIVRSGGVDVSDTSLGAPPPAPTPHIGVNIRVHDDGETVSACETGTTILDSLDISGAAYAGLRAAQLQPYFAVINRAPNILREVHLHDLRLIMDGGR